VTYRNAPQPPPLIVALRSQLLAVDPDTGAKRWHQKLPGGVTRLFKLETSVFVAQDRALRWFDIDTGEPLGTLDLGFAASAGIASGNRLFLAGDRIVACITAQGAIVWNAQVEGVQTVRIFGEDPLPILICRDAEGRELWRFEVEGYNRPALLLGEIVAQPDLVGAD
jgi:outer membrane protein assembly factor BamB